MAKRTKLLNELLEMGIICQICGVSFQLTSEIKTDHSHDTDRARGLLCNNCNVGLGMFQDNPKLLRRAAEYLTTHQQIGLPTTDKKPRVKDIKKATGVIAQVGTDRLLDARAIAAKLKISLGDVFKLRRIVVDFPQSVVMWDETEINELQKKHSAQLKTWRTAWASTRSRLGRKAS